MIIGVPKEIKTEEYRVAVTPDGVRELKRRGHTVLVEASAGDGSGFSDDEYLAADADIVDKGSLFRGADLIVKVKEPLPSEFSLFRENQAIFTYLHLAPNRELTDFLLARKITAFAYETLEEDGSLPLLAPMSEVAGRMAPLMAAFYLQREYGGTGLLPAGAAGVGPAKALILGAGVVGMNAARVASGIGMRTVVMNRGIGRLRQIDELFRGTVETRPLTPASLELEIRDADAVICAVLVPGGRTPVLIRRKMLTTMKNGAVIVDVSIDQGGCAETSRPTTHTEPVYTVDGVIHYAVANMPGAFPKTSTLALTNATLPYVARLADLSIDGVMETDPVFGSALNTRNGKIVNQALAGESTGA